MIVKPIASRTWTLVMLVTLPAWALCGCASPAQIAAQDDQACQSYGMFPGMPDYAACRAQLADAHQAQGAEVLRGFGQALSASGNCANMTAEQAFACGFAAGR
jgi:hypothetical protein